MKNKRKRFIKNKRILSFFRKKKNKKIVLISLLTMIFVFFLYYIISFIFIAKFEVDLERLKRTYNEEVICRQACFKEREELVKAISKGLEKKDKNVEKIEKEIINEEGNVDYRKKLVNILSNSFGEENVPIFLNEYFLNEKGDDDVKKEILYSYEFANGLDDYFYILQNNFSLKIKRAAIIKISNIENNNYFKLEHIRIIDDLIFNKNTADKLRQDLILLLANYQKIYENEVNLILEEVLNSNFLNDSISRAFAADFLGREEINVLESEWKNYYSN